MRIITPGKVNLEHIMWEPQGSCSHNCNGCYAAFSPARYFAGEPIHLNNDSNVSANQLTLSLNSGPNDIGRNFMLRLISDAPWWSKRFPELCITCHDETTLALWSGNLSTSIVLSQLPVKMVSLSTCPTKYFSDMCKEKRIHLNWNALAEPGLDISKAKDKVDSVYLILKKSPLGDKQDKEAVIVWRDLFLQSVEGFDFKVIPDACVVESFGFMELGLACSAGISKLHVWADGGCTGCPYDSKRVIHKKEKHKVSYELLKELQWASASRSLNDSPIEFCGIWSAVDEVDMHDVKKVVAYQGANI